MNLIEFQNILSSPNQERLVQFPLTSIIFNMINGCAFNEEDLIGVNVTEDNQIVLDFLNDEISDRVVNTLNNQVVAGVCGGSNLYKLYVSKQDSSVLITFITN